MEAILDLEALGAVATVWDLVGVLEAALVVAIEVVARAETREAAT